MTSYVLDYENSRNTNEIGKYADEIIKTGVKEKDEYGRCDDCS